MNPEAEKHFTQGLTLHLEGQNITEAVKELETAINLGLPHRDEMAARFFLGEGYTRLQNTNLRGEQMINSHEFKQALTQMEIAVQMDAQGGYLYFKEYRSLLNSLDLYYVLIGDYLQETQGDNEAINFYVQKLNLFNYLQTQPLLKVLLQLGIIYANKEDFENANRCFLAIRDAEVVNPNDEMEIQVRQMAENNLNSLKSEPTAKSGCFIATAAYGSPIAPEVMIFRQYRDEVLLNSKIGKEIVKIYYLFSPSLALVISKTEWLKRLVRTLALNPLLKLLKAQKNKEKNL